MLSQLASLLQSVRGSVLLSWVAMLLVAAVIALIASGRPKGRYRRWVADFFVRWGLAGLFLWFVFFSFWALREVLAQSFVFPVGPIQGFIENATLWGVVLTGFLTVAFFGGTLLLQAIFAKGIELPEGVVYYRQEVLMTPQKIAAREVWAKLEEPPSELKEEAAAKAVEAKARNKK
ncbi:MAG: hypothetical protein QXP98_06395 [Thermoproteus sp.]